VPRGPKIEVSSYLLHLLTGAKTVCRNVVVLIDNYPSVHLYPVIFHMTVCQGKVKAIPVQTWTDTEDSIRLRLPDFQTDGGKIASPTHRPPLSPRKYLCHRES
jgi:hypothetical protein